MRMIIFFTVGKEKKAFRLVMSSDHTREIYFEVQGIDALGDKLWLKVETPHVHAMRVLRRAMFEAVKVIDHDDVITTINIGHLETLG